MELPLGMPRNPLSPEYDHPGASPLVRCRGSTAVSLSRTPQRVPSHRTYSSTCFYRAPGSLPPYGQSRDSGSTDLSPLRTLQETHPILIWFALSKVWAGASNSLAKAFLVPLKGFLVRDTFTPEDGSSCMQFRTASATSLPLSKRRKTNPGLSNSSDFDP